MSRCAGRAVMERRRKAGDAWADVGALAWHEPLANLWQPDHIT